MNFWSPYKTSAISFIYMYIYVCEHTHTHMQIYICTIIENGIKTQKYKIQTLSTQNPIKLKMLS